MAGQRTYEPGTIAWVDLSCRATAPATEFYGGVFGWEAVSQGPAEDTGGYAIFQLDPDATATQVTALGGEVCVPPFDLPTGRVAVLGDLDNAVFSVLGPAAAPAD